MIMFDLDNPAFCHKLNLKTIYPYLELKNCRIIFSNKSHIQMRAIHKGHGGTSMMTINKKSMMWLLMAALFFGAVLVSGSPHLRASVAGSSSQMQIIKDVTPQEAYSLIQENKTNPKFVILDVRTPREFAGGHIEGAVNLDYNAPTFKEDLNGLDKTKMYLVYCRTGRRSRGAFDMMKALEFQEVYHMLGGIVGWTSEGLPTTK
jgi:rhodanese-related sulfurtransferase